MNQFMVASPKVSVEGDGISDTFNFFGPFKSFKKADAFAGMLEGEPLVLPLKDPMK